MPQPTAEEVLRNDPFYDPEETQLDLRNSPEPLGGLNTNDVLNPEIVTNVDGIEQPAEEVEVEAAPEPAKKDPEPEVTEYDDGSSVTVKKTSKGWEATLDTGTGAPPEVFKGATQAEMWQNVAVGKIHATRKIRDLNRTVKLGIGVPAPQTLETTASPAAPTANDTFDVKAKWEEDPIEAVDLAVKKKTGYSLDELKQRADRGAAAEAELAREQVGKDFKSSNPDYVMEHNNYLGILGWLAKYKLGVNLIPDTYNGQGKLVSRGNEDQIQATLVARGLYTVDNLSIAWDSLKEDGLAVLDQFVEDEPAPVVDPPKPKPRTQPRAGLGIRTAATTPVTPSPQVDTRKLEELSDEEIAKQLAEIRSMKLRNPALYEQLKGQARR